MKILKYLFFLILIFIIGFSIYIATLDSQFLVQEKHLVQAPKELLFDEVNNYQTWENWHPWVKGHDNYAYTYTEKNSGENAGYSVLGDDMDGSLRTTAVIPRESITQELVFTMPFGKSTSTTYWAFETKKNGTEVTWGVKGELSFWEKVYQLTQDSVSVKTIRPQLKAGLKNLAISVKTAMEKYSINVNGVTLHSGGYYMYMTTAVRLNSMALVKKKNKIIPLIRLYMKQNNIRISGAPLMVFNSLDKESGTAIISVGLPSENRIITPAEIDILSGFLPSQKTVKTTLKGNSKHLLQAWKAGEEFLEKNNYSHNKDANLFISFNVSAQTTQNPAKWISNVYIPIKEK